jgi:hypothetical protein
VSIAPWRWDSRPTPKAIASLEDPGINAAVWNGGPIAQLSAATAAAGGTTVTTFVDGKPVVLVPGAPPFVAAPFDQAYPQGYVAAGTIVFVAR